MEAAQKKQDSMKVSVGLIPLIGLVVTAVCFGFSVDATFWIIHRLGVMLGPILALLGSILAFSMSIVSVVISARQSLTRPLN